MDGFGLPDDTKNTLPLDWDLDELADVPISGPYLASTVNDNHVNRDAGSMAFDGRFDTTPINLNVGSMAFNTGPFNNTSMNFNVGPMGFNNAATNQDTARVAPSPRYPPFSEPVPGFSSAAAGWPSIGQLPGLQAPRNSYATSIDQLEVSRDPVFGRQEQSPGFEATNLEFEPAGSYSGLVASEEEPEQSDLESEPPEASGRAKKKRARSAKPIKATKSDYAVGGTRDELTGLFFTSSAMATASDRVTAFKCPNNDDTIPEEGTLEEVETVKNLVAAIRNSEGVKERGTAPSFKHRWAAGSTYFSDIVVEKLAWSMFQWTRYLHRKGWIFPIYDDQLMGHIKSTKDWNFEKRMSAIHNLLMRSKRTCEDLFKGEKLMTVLGAPHILDARSNSNKNSNLKKAKRITVATELEKQKKAKDAAEAATMNGGIAPDTPPKRKRKRAGNDDAQVETKKPRMTKKATGTRGRKRRQPTPASDDDYEDFSE